LQKHSGSSMEELSVDSRHACHTRSSHPPLARHRAAHTFRKLGETTNPERLTVAFVVEQGNSESCDAADDTGFAGLEHPWADGAKLGVPREGGEDASWSSSLIADVLDACPDRDSPVQRADRFVRYLIGSYVARLHVVAVLRRRVNLDAAAICWLVASVEQQHTAGDREEQKAGNNRSTSAFVDRTQEAWGLTNPAMRSRDSSIPKFS
jgi:hypothetical protein